MLSCAFEFSGTYCIVFYKIHHPFSFTVDHKKKTENEIVFDQSMYLFCVSFACFFLLVLEDVLACTYCTSASSVLYTSFPVNISTRGLSWYMPSWLYVWPLYGIHAVHVCPSPTLCLLQLCLCLSVLCFIFEEFIFTIMACFFPLHSYFGWNFSPFLQC